MLTLSIFPINIFRAKTNYHESKESKLEENLRQSTESGGGYTMDPYATYSWIELVGSGGTNMTGISDHDDSYQKINISELGGWTFTFYETVYDSIYVSSNGWMSFTNEGDTEDWLDDIPIIDEKNFDCVGLFCDDLSTEDPPWGSGDIYYRFYGTTPGSRYLVIEYYQISYLGGAYLGTFEVIFYESGDIKFQYQNLQDIYDFYIIGLDHGDLTNYNSFDDWVDGQTINSKAISFTFAAMAAVSYDLSINENDQISWIVTKVNDEKMSSYFGNNWEQKFGLAANPSIGFKTKINITSIEQNSTHWEINYTIWDWINRLNSFPSTSISEDSILYRKEPLDYNYEHNLTNLVPYFVPKPTILYLKGANLSYFYEDIDYASYSGLTWLGFEDEKLINGHWIEINGEAEYDSNGILKEVYIEMVNHSIWEVETIFEMVFPSTELLLEFQLGFNINDEFAWKVTHLNNYYMEQCFGTNWEQKLGLFSNPEEGEKTMIKVSSISENETHWDIKYDMWNWIDNEDEFDENPDIDPQLVYRKDPLNYTQTHNLTNIAPFLLPKATYFYLKYANLDENLYDWFFYFFGITDINLDFDDPGLYPHDWLYGYVIYDQNGVLETLDLVYEYEVGDEDYEITIFRMIATSPEPPDDEDEDDDEKEEPNPFLKFMTSPVGWITILSVTVAGVIGIGVIIWYFKKKR